MTRSAMLITVFGLLLALSSPDGVVSRPETTPATELFFSEYLEGSGYDKALEIFNGTSEAVDLSSYSVRMYFNGKTGSGTTLTLDGEVEPRGVHVVAHSSAAPEIIAKAHETVGGGWFNGDDAVALLRGSMVVDVIGQVGSDPGSQWGEGLTSTYDSTLRRLPTTCAGDREGADPFDPLQEWEGFGTNSFAGLGAHATECPPGPYAQEPQQPEGGPVVPIYQVQGDGAASPLRGELVTIRGVVVGDFQLPSEFRGFFVQEVNGDGLEETSDGIFVFHEGTDVTVGDEVEVTGQVEEFYGLTELTRVSALEVVGKILLPEPVKVSLPLAEGIHWEQYEGMLVTVESEQGELSVTEVYHLGRGGLALLADRPLVQFTQDDSPDVEEYAKHRQASERRTLVLDDGAFRQNPDPIKYAAAAAELTAHETLRVGDTTDSVIGVISYSDNGWRGTDAFRIHPTQPVAFQPTNPRPLEPPVVGGRIQVATFNVLNFFNGDGGGHGFPTARGADTPYELQRQLDKLVSAIVPLEAEVLGLVEIENDGGEASALADLIAGLNRVAGAGTYAHVETGPLGADGIRVALAYQPAQVQPVGRYQVLGSSQQGPNRTRDPRFDDTLNRPALARTFEEVATGARFTVIVNHLKSKGSGCPGDPDLHDGQGNCNLTRLAAAQALADWAQQLGRQSNDTDVLLIGDLNSYAMEDPIRHLLDNGFVNPLGEEDVTYVFRGEGGTLDYALASRSLAEQVAGAAVWQINAQEPSVLDYNVEYKSRRHVQLLYAPIPYRSSDHDPVVVGLDLNTGPSR